ncbi:general secretion pathway protein GspC [Archangium violaceum]|uniref:type II secretion system protein GspC n=1 Tax=Archangium violaceum TaxID=83451 RepID=UPI00194E9544|nr:type II secretion system protein GspC [Archangium violaceum]QRN99754.1 general secretion pathway protein GspC [Archangium violaceum]
MSTLVRPSFRALTLLCAACLGLTAAHAVNTVVEAWLLPFPSFEQKAPAPPKKEEMPTPLALASLARYTGLPDKLREQVISAGPGDEPVPTVLELKLLGTMTASPPAISLASVYEGPARRTRSVWTGGEVLGAEVIAIERTRVLILNAGRLEYIGAGSGKGAESKEPRVSSPPAQADAASGIDIRQVGPQVYELSRQEVDTLLANPSDVLMQARIAPVFRDGKPQGFKMFSIRPGSLYVRLGLQNGDTLRRINGLSLEGVEQGLEAFNQLRDASRIELEVERNGQPIRYTYSMR